MNKPRIIKTGILPKLKEMLLEDIRVLESMKQNREKDGNVYELISSLIESKNEILEMIPGRGLYAHGGLPSTPDRKPIKRYLRTETTDINDQVKLVKIFRQLEAGQMDFVQGAMRSVGIPSGIKSILREILSKYMKITEQLDRISKTGSVGRVVL